MISIAEHLSSRQLSWDAAAEKAGLSAERLRQVAGGAEASLGEMRRIAKALRVPLSSIVDEAPAEPIKMLFRQTIDQRAACVASSVEVLSAQIRDALTLVDGLQKNTGWLDLFRGLDANVQGAEQFANLFRKAYGELDDSEPFLQLGRVVEEVGVYVLYCRDSSIEGVSAIVDGYAFILLGARRFKPRMLFTIAHEVGHLVARHDRRDASYAMLDSEKDFDGFVNTPQKAEEKFADEFASALVLPRHGVLKALKAIRAQLKAAGPLGDVEILWLSRFFGVSFEVAARRCEQLTLLPDRGARALYQRLKDDFGNPEKRAEQLGLPARENFDIDPSPALLQAAAQRVRAGSLSVGRAAELLNVPVSALVVANAGMIG